MAKMEYTTKTIQHLAEGSAFLLVAVVCIIKFRRFRGDSKEVIRKLPLLLLIEIIFWLPHFVLTTVLVLKSWDILESEIYFIISFVIRVPLLLVKPIFYFFYHEDLRKEFLSIIPSCFKKPPVVESCALHDNENL